MSKHTKGPWKQKGMFISFEDSTHIVAEVNPKAKAWDANARLIAAAPELLRACKVVLESMHESIAYGGNKHLRAGNGKNLSIMLENAVALAEGRKERYDK